MRRVLPFYVLIVIGCVFANIAFAKPPKKAVALPTVVLLPIILHGEQSKDVASGYQGAVTESLKSRYTVIAGTKVEEVLKKATLKESQEENCDLTRCYGAVATHFNAEYLAVVNVTKTEGDYLLSLKVLNIIDNVVVMAPTASCDQCRPSQVMAKLKLLAGGEKAASAPSVYVKKGGGGFWIEKYLVTQEAYERVTGQSPSYFKNCPACPVEHVNWDEATSYCSKVGKSLPKEEDWEYAATSGGKSETWAGTSNESELGDYAWYDKNSGNKTHPVGEKKPNGLGLYDMSGNVWEWTDSWWNSSQKYRVLRGGSWGGSAGRLRAASRNGGAPVRRYLTFGFRCAQY